MVNNPTHKLVITVVSSKDDPNVTLTMEFDPLLSDEEVQDLGYVPAAYKLAENFLFSIENIIDTESLMEYSEEDLGLNRTLN